SGKGASPHSLRIVWMSLWQIPAALMAITTSFGRGSRRSIVAIRNGWSGAVFCSAWVRMGMVPPRGSRPRARPAASIRRPPAVPAGSELRAPHLVGERCRVVRGDVGILLLAPQHPPRVVAVAREGAAAAHALGRLEPDRALGVLARLERERAAALDDERLPRARGVLLAPVAGRPVPAPPDRDAPCRERHEDAALEQARTGREPVPPGVEIVHVDDAGARLRGQPGGELGLPRAGAAVDDRERRARHHDAPSHTGRNDPAAIETPIASAATEIDRTSIAASARPTVEGLAHVRVGPPKPRASIAVASVPPRRSATTSRANADWSARRTAPVSPSPRARRASAICRQSSPSTPKSRVPASAAS